MRFQALPSLTTLLALSSLASAALPQSIDLQAIHVESSGGTFATAAVFLGSEDVLLELERQSVFSTRVPNRSLSKSDRVKSYSGKIAGEPGSRIAATVRGGRLRALVWRSDGGQPWWIAPASEIDPTMPVEFYSAIHSRDLPASAVEFTCVDASERSNGPLEDRSVGEAARSNTIYEAEILGEADYEYVQMAGSRQAALDLMEETIFFMSAIYEFTFGIRLVVFDLVAYDDPNDPYSAKGAASVVLNEFQSEMASRYRPEDWDLGQLFTARAGISGGYAYCNRFCRNEQTLRAVSFVDFKAALANRVSLSAHEVGHNLGAGHCNQAGGSCGSSIDPTGCGIMDSGGSGGLGIRFGEQSVAVISGNPYLYDCIEPALRSDLLPSLSAISPLTLEALWKGSGIQTVDLVGAQLASVHQVKIDGEILTLENLRVVDQANVYVEPPTPTALGTVSVSAANAVGWSNSVTFTYVATNPPRMLPPPGPFVYGFTTEFGGSPGVAYQVLISDQDSTMSIRGFDVLSSPIHTDAGTLDAVGLGTTFYLPPLRNTTYWLQFLTRGADGSFYADDVIEVFYQ